MSRKRTAATMTAAALACALALTGSSPGNSGDGHRQVPWQADLTHPTPGAPVGAEENYTILEDQLFFPHPEEWGGAYVDGPQLVVITVTRPVAEARQLLVSLGVVRNIKVIQGDVSIAQLNEVTADVMADDTLDGVVTSAGPQYSASQVVVAMSRPDDAALTTLATIDPDLIVAYEEPGMPAATSRYYDASPYYGGNHTPFSGGGETGGCSSAFSWTTTTGGYGMVSAAHCAYTPTANRTTVNRKTSAGSNVAIGQVAVSSGLAGGTRSGQHGDWVVWKLTTSGQVAAGRVYTGTNNTTTSRRVISRVSLPENWKGSTLYTSGSGAYYGNGDGQVHPDWVSLVNQTINYKNGQTYTNLSIAEHVSDCTGGGDSGGAVYLTSGTSDAKAVGIISGSNHSGALLTNCRNYFTPLSYIASDYGGSLRLG